MGLAATWVCETAAQLESEIGLPAGSLQATVDLYNRHAAAGEDPLFHKGPAWVRPLVPPIGAIDLRIGPAPYAPFTLGGLETTVDGEVLDLTGERHPGPLRRRAHHGRGVLVRLRQRALHRGQHDVRPLRRRERGRGVGLRLPACPDAAIVCNDTDLGMTKAGTERREAMDLDLLDLYRRASEWTSTKVAGAVSKLDAPTSCDGWDVRTLMNHMLQTQRYFVGAARGEDVSPPVGTPPDLVSDDPRADFDQARAETVKTFEEPGVIEKTGPALGHRIQRPAAARVGSGPVAPGRKRRCPTGSPKRPTHIIHGRFTDDQRKGVFKPEIASPPTRPPRTGSSPTPDAILHRRRDRYAASLPQRGVLDDPGHDGVVGPWPPSRSRTGAAGRTRSSAAPPGPAVRSTSSSVSRSAMSMPLDTPAAVMMRSSRCSTTRCGRGLGAVGRELARSRPSAWWR